jgi:hypothetical protein
MKLLIMQFSPGLSHYQVIFPEGLTKNFENPQSEYSVPYPKFEPGISPI